MRGMTSLQPAVAASNRTMSPSLFMGRGSATAEELLGKARGSLLKPHAMARSSMMSHWWRTSARVMGTDTSSAFPPLLDGLAVYPMRSRSVHISDGDRSSPVT